MHVDVIGPLTPKAATTQRPHSSTGLSAPAIWRVRQDQVLPHAGAWWRCWCTFIGLGIDRQDVEARISEQSSDVAQETLSIDKPLWRRLPHTRQTAYTAPIDTPDQTFWRALFLQALHQTGTVTAVNTDPTLLGNKARDHMSSPARGLQQPARCVALDGRHRSRTHSAVAQR